MKCLVCNSEFNEPRFLKDLFRTKIFHVCQSCLNKYPLKINFILIPLDYHQLEIVFLFPKDKNINYNAFLEEYSKIYENISFLNQDKLIIPYEKIYLTEENLTSFDQISTLLDKDIIVLTNILQE